MKALLEFDYPDDEFKLKHALKGIDYYEALVRITHILAEPCTKAEAYNRIKKIINSVTEDV